MFHRHLWRPGPARLTLLLAGLWLFGSGEAMIVASELGNSPWTVLAEGVAENTALDIGAATIVISLLILVAWFPLRQTPGLGTVLNAIVIGVALGITLGLLPNDPAAELAWPLLFGGIALVAIGGGIYLGARLGPGPRDGLMTGLHARTGRSLRLMRTLIEVSAMTAGFALGGTVGIGTAAFALLIGPGVQKALEVASPSMAKLR